MISFLAVNVSTETFPYYIKGGCLRDIISGDQINDLDISLYDKTKEEDFLKEVTLQVNEFLKLAKNKTPSFKDPTFQKVGKVNKILISFKEDKVLEIEISVPSDFGSKAQGFTNDLYMLSHT